MNKNTIWLIVGLMTAALIGIVITQAYWINYAVKLNEEQFDKNIGIVLENIANRFEKDELHQAFKSEFFPTTPPKEQDPESSIFDFLESNPDFSRTFSFEGIVPPESYPNMAIAKYFATSRITTTFDKVIEDFTEMVAAETVRRMPLSSRIKPEVLNQEIITQLSEKGVDLDFNYGVFDNRKRQFIYMKDSDEETFKKGPDIDQQTIDQLKNSSYRVNLLPEYARGSSVVAAAGKLFIDFPGKRNFLLSSVWLMMLGAIGFTSIILFSFIYTVREIFRQKKLSEIKNDFLNNMTHEFKTPIATISLAADSITNPSVRSDEAKVTRFANIIKEENRRMNRQVERVLQMAMIDKQDFQVKFEEINVNEIILNAVLPFSIQIDNKKGILDYELNAENPIITADKTHFTNVIHNLLDNANKYSPETPKIKISSSDHKNGIMISVKDNGIGMSKEDKKLIFDKFFRVHTGDVHDVKGFGLGLSYVKAIMNAHSGTIDVRSELGKGSEFIIYFPKNPK